MPYGLLLHGGHAVGWGAWDLKPTVVAVAFVVCGFYAYALVETRSRLDWRRAACFYAGALAMFLALVSPLDAASHRLLSMHMLQHVVLSTIGPPLVLLGLPPSLLRPLLGPGAAGRLLRGLTNPVFAAALFLVNMWLWHVPPVYEEALTNLPVHVTMHVCFIVSGLLYWWPVVDPLPEMSRISDGGRLLYLFVSGFPMALLALLLLATGSVVYDYYETAPRLWGVSALADQQVAGVIMGALGEAASFVAISLLFLRFLDREEALDPPSTRSPADAR